MIDIRFSHTHLYPGTCGSATGDVANGVAECRVEFSDGVRVPARIDREGEHLILSIAAHSTVRGTDVPAKRWVVQVERGATGDAQLRIARRLSDPA